MPSNWWEPQYDWTTNPEAARASQARVNSASLYGQSGGSVAPTSAVSISGIVDQINSINQRAQQAANAGRIPGGAALEADSSANISRALAGEVDPSVLQQLGQRSAERGIMTGSPSGPGTNAEYLRSLGLSSLDLMNTGQNWLTQATNRNPAAPIYNAGNQVLTAEQQVQADLERQRLELEQQRLNQSVRGGGGGGGGGGGIAHPSTITSSGNPAINWNDLFAGNNSPITFISETDWNASHPTPGSTGGNMTAGTGGTGGNNGNWFDQMLWDNASDVTPGPMTGNDYNWQDYGGYG